MKKIKRNLNQTGWFISRAVEVNRRKFYDKDYGGSEYSYAAAEQEIESTVHTRKLETHVRSNKKSLAIVGITYYTIRDGRQIKHRFAVCNPNTGKPKMVHIGNDNTYEKNWERKLAEAQTLRDKFVQDHRDSHS